MDTNIYCKLTPMPNDNSKYICVNCGSVFDESNKFGNICPIIIDKLAMDPNMPSVRLDKTTVVSQDGKNEEFNWWDTSVVPYVPSQKHSEQEIRKQCSQEQIEKRLAICQACPFYENNTCLKCGCSLSRDRVYMNKLNWADQSCPIGKWGPES